MDNSNSKILLNRAIKILDYAGIDISSWAIGGGTVLAHYYNHRLSKDIDIFIDDMQLLNSLSPRFNDIHRLVIVIMRFSILFLISN